jgi:hypothetical protein
MEVAFFEYLCVSSEELEQLDGDWQQLPARQWRLEYSPGPTAEVMSAERQRCLSVLDKVIARGHVTLLSPGLESVLQARDTAAAAGTYPAS